MIEINKEIENKLNYVGVGLSELQRLSKIIQAFLTIKKILKRTIYKLCFIFLNLKYKRLKRI